MQKMKLSNHPLLLKNFNGAHDEVTAALKRTWLMLGCVALSSMTLVIYVLAVSRWA